MKVGEEDETDEAKDGKEEDLLVDEGEYVEGEDVGSIIIKVKVINEPQMRNRVHSAKEEFAP